MVGGRSVDLVAAGRRWRVDRVVAHGWVAPIGRERGARRVSERLHVPFELYDGETLLPPGSLRSMSGQPYAVFTAFDRTLSATTLIGAPAGGAARAARTACKYPTCEDLERSLFKPSEQTVLPGRGVRCEETVAPLSPGSGGRLSSKSESSRRRRHERLSAELKFGTLCSSAGVEHSSVARFAGAKFQRRVSQRGRMARVQPQAPCWSAGADRREKRGDFVRFHRATGRRGGTRG